MKNETDNMPFGECTFQITTANELMLNALTKYSMMLDYVTKATDDETLNIEGLINSILSEGMQRRIKELVKKHGFDDASDFIDTLSACSDGEKADIEIRNREQTFYQKTHDEILSFIPIEDKQMDLFTEKKAKEK